ncbi:MAG: MFS transporter [Solirubrobacteraceae bacterium]
MSTALRLRAIVLALVAGLALADASIVTLALPELLVELDTGVEGVAAVLGVYTGVLALALVPAWWIVRARGPVLVGATGLVVFALAAIACGVAGSLPALLAGRAVSAVGAAAGLVAAFALMIRGASEPLGRRLWPLAAVVGTATGPALGGALTQAFDWRAIFLVQAPIALAGAAACLVGSREGRGEARVEGGSAAARVESGSAAAPGAAPRTAAAIALALISAALTAVLFLLVLLLVAGWSVEPLRAALAVSVIPLAALAGSRVRGDPRSRAVAGSLLLAGGVLALAFLPDAELGWTVVPQLAAGAGMGLALPALAGALLFERSAADAAQLLAIRHAGIALALVAIAPIAAADLDRATDRARQRGVALVLDADLPARRKLDLAPELLAGVEAQDPRAGLERALAEQRPRFTGEQRFVFDRLARRADETLVLAIGEAFTTVLLVTGGLALLAAFLLLPRARHPARLAAVLASATALAGGYALLYDAISPEPVIIVDPCNGRDLPESGGLDGLLQKGALDLLDRAACRAGSSREELVLALADEDEARRFRERHGVDPSTVGELLRRALE